MASRKDPRVDAYIRDVSPALAAILRAARAAIRRAAPELSESLFRGVPHYRGTGFVCYLAEYRDHVNLGFHHGAQLRDRGRILEGTGAGLRHVKLRAPSDARMPALARLIREAVAFDRRSAAKTARPKP